MEYKGLTSTQLADTIEVPRATVSHILSGRNNPSLDVVLKLLSYYMEVDRNWLLFGEGTMLTNLATAGKPANAVPPAEKEPPQADAAVQKEPHPIEKVQEPAPAVNGVAAEGKAVEQIMVLYTDKTFSTYRPA